MSKGLKVVGVVAGVAALVAGTIATGGGLGIGAGTILGASASTVAAVAGTVSTLAMTAASETQKPPPVKGSITDVVIQANSPQPHAIGRTYCGGHLIHDVGYGGGENPYRSMVMVWSGSGPVEAIEAFQSDFTTISFSGGNASGYYADFMYLDSQLGATPEADALAGPFGAIPKWGSSYGLSGYAAGLVTLVWDKDGKKFASGVPQFGAILQGVKCYDPRADSTYPGGSGAQRALDESTYEWSENPGVHGPTYALGRWENGKKVFGCGFAVDSIDWPAWVAFANTCDANGWKVGGLIYEPGSKWDNLKRICAAGGGEPCWVGAKLSVKFNAPKVTIDTISAADLADGEISVPGMKTWRDRLNGLVPKYRSEAHKWEYVQSALVSVPEYVTEDRGEEKTEERQIDLCQWADQAAQLCAYELANRREIEPIILPLKPRFIEYRIGEAFDLADDMEETGLVGKVLVMIGRKIDPGTGIIEGTFVTETDAKHAFALGKTGTAPPTPTILTGEEMDIVAGQLKHRETIEAIAGSYTRDLAGNVTATTDGTTAEITVPEHTRVYPALGRSVLVPEKVFSGLPLSTRHYIAYDDPELDGPADADWVISTVAADGYYSETNQFRHHATYTTTPAADGTGGSSGGSGPPGSGGWNPGGDGAIP